MKTLQILIFVLSFSVINFALKAQSKTDKITLERNAGLLETKDLKDAGILVKTGKDYANSKNLDLKLRHYDANLNLVWDVPIEKTQINKGFTNPIVASPDGDYVYQIEPKGYNVTFGAGKEFMTQINKDGKIQTHEFANVKDWGYMQMAFCDDEFLYFLATENGDETSDRKKVDEKLFLNKIKHSDLSFSYIKLDLPKIENPKITTFWEYAGHSNGKIYLVSKTVDTDEGKNDYQILIIDSDGKIINKISINAALQGKFIRPSFNLKLFPANYQYKDNDFYSYYDAALRMTTMHQNTGAYGGIRIDDKNSCIYIYGLYGSKPFTNLAAAYEGYFIYKYDFEGKNSWKIQNEVSKELASDGYFHIHSTPYGRNLVLNINPDQTIKFQIWFKDQVHSYEFSEKGDPTQAYINKYDRDVSMGEVSMACSSSKKLKSKEYLKSLTGKGKKGDFKYFVSSKGEIIIKETDDAVELLFFDLPK